MTASSAFSVTVNIRVVAEVTDWRRQTPEALQMWRDRLAGGRLDDRAEIVN
jgi:rifampin ADP-ribosylating transferase